jgi:leucine-rich repeat protein SHOC2
LCVSDFQKYPLNSNCAAGLKYRRIDRRKARLRKRMTPEEVEQAIATARDNRSTYLSFKGQKISILPESIGNCINLTGLDLEDNQLTTLPDSISNLTNLTLIELSDNPLMDLSVLANIPNLTTVRFFNINLPRRYWTKFSEWKTEWLLDEDNAEIRRTLIEQVGYNKICTELNSITLDTWWEYTLLKIDKPVDVEPMVLLKMTCPSTAHIHILRVPPEMVSAEEAITWVNHGIHPDEFTVQT